MKYSHSIIIAGAFYLSQTSFMCYQMGGRAVLVARGFEEMISFPEAPTPTAPAPASHHLQGVVEGLPQTPHTKVTGRAPTITPHPQLSPPLNGPRRKRHRRRPELKLNHSAVGKLKGSSSGTRTMLHQEGRKQT